MFNKLLGTLLLGAATFGATSAFAQSMIDLPTDNPFSGFYAGVHVGYGSANTDEAIGMYSDAFGDSYGLNLYGDWSNSLDGATLGAQAGVNVVLDQGLVIGGEVSVSWAALQGSGDSYGELDYYCQCDVDFGSYEANIDGLGTAELKLGYATEQFMVYGSAGIALANVTSSAMVGGDSSDGDWIAQHTTSNVMQGWTVGVGGAVMVTPTTSVNASVNYYDFGTIETMGAGSLISEDEGDTPVGVMRSIGVTAATVKFGINHHF